MGFDETVFLTGFPGFIAGRLIQRLASEGARLLVLVQPALVERARQDIARIARETNVSENNFRILQGDITAENLGLSTAELETARSETTTIFHLAAIYDLAVERDPGMRVNVGGTRNVNNFARRVRGLRRYHYVSTCYVAGKRKGVILETDLRHEAGFRNHYEESKYYAELEVEREQTIDSLRRLKESVLRRPNSPDLRAALGKALRYSGLLQESLQEFLKVRELDQNMDTSIAHTYFMMGDYENARRSIHRDIFYLGPLVMAMLGGEKEAIKILRETMERNPDRQFRAYHQGLLGALEGDHEAARRAGNVIVEHNRDPEALFYVTRSFARIGDVDRALEVLERLSRSFFSPFTFEHDPWLEPIRKSPRFAEILRAAKERQAEARAVWS